MLGTARVRPAEQVRSSDGQTEVARVRWDDLFRDLEAQLESADAAELAADVAEGTRRETARLRLLDRLLPTVGHPVRVRVAGLAPIGGRLAEVGAEWLLLEDAPGRQTLVPLASVLAVGGLGARSAPPGQEGQVFARLGLTSALRGIARDRLPVSVWLTDGTSLPGSVDRVGADFLELAEHGAGEPRRGGEVRGFRVVPFHALAAVRST
ncbi:MAG: hypothetical protein ACRDV1_01710 [Actinomycetes bacterium]